jgi:hypothetical protein
MPDIAPDLMAYLESPDAADASIATARSIISLRWALGRPLPASCYQQLRRIFEDHDAGRVIRVFDAAE